MDYFIENKRTVITIFRYVEIKYVGDGKSFKFKLIIDKSYLGHWEFRNIFAAWKSKSTGCLRILPVFSLIAGRSESPATADKPNIKVQPNFNREWLDIRPFFITVIRRDIIFNIWSNGWYLWKAGYSFGYLFRRPVGYLARYTVSGQISNVIIGFAGYTP